MLIATVLRCCMQRAAHGSNCLDRGMTYAGENRLQKQRVLQNRSKARRCLEIAEPDDMRRERSPGPTRLAAEIF